MEKSEEKCSDSSSLLKKPPPCVPDTPTLTGELLQKAGCLTHNRCSADVCGMTNG